MIASLRKRVNRLKKDRVQGAGQLATEALSILGAACAESLAPTAAKLISEIHEVTKALADSRPMMVSIANYVMQFETEFGLAAAKGGSPGLLKKGGVAVAARLLKHAEDASMRAPRAASQMISHRSIVMTCSYSSCVCKALELAKENGTDFKVLAVDSLYEKTSYGEMTRARLGKSDIACRIVPDNQIGWQVARADIILIGTDAVSLHGWLINGIPSLELAIAAARRKVPVYAVGESSKVDVRGILAGILGPDPGFDSLQFELISGIVTDRGILAPDEIYRTTVDDVFGSPRARPH